MLLLQPVSFDGGAHLTKSSMLRLNVGFLLHQHAGASRDFNFELPSVQVGEDLDFLSFNGSLRLTRTHEGLYAEGRFGGRTRLECVRCLSEFDQRLGVEVQDLFVYPPGRATDPLLAVPETAMLDLGPVLREYFLLQIPMQALCRPHCKGLCGECGVNLNEERCDHPQTEIDPRLAALKALLPDS